MANPIDIELHALGAEAAAGSGPAVDIGELRSAVRLFLTVAAVVGQVIVTLQTSPDGVSGWRDVEKWPAVGKASRQVRCFDGCDQFVRVSWSAAATFAVTGEAHVLYATREDVLGSEILAAAVHECTMHQWADCLINASAATEDAIATSNPLPLTKWPPSVRDNTAAITAWKLIRARGVDANSVADMAVKDAHDDAQKWLRAVADGKIKPPGLTPGDNLGSRAVDGAGQPITEPTPTTAARFFGRWGDFG